MKRVKVVNQCVKLIEWSMLFSNIFQCDRSMECNLKMHYQIGHYFINVNVTLIHTYIQCREGQCADKLL